MGAKKSVLRAENIQPESATGILEERSDKMAKGSHGTNPNGSSTGGGRYGGESGSGGKGKGKGKGGK